jgi:hypothetical protein
MEHPFKNLVNLREGNGISACNVDIYSVVLDGFSNPSRSKNSFRIIPYTNKRSVSLQIIPLFP